jgi:rifampicin phosphotransferase
MDSYVLDLQEIDQTQVAVAGGKGAHLGALTRIEGVRVPAGFCVTTEAFRRTLEEVPSVAARLDRLSRLDPEDREALRAVSAEVRRTIERTAMPHDVASAITGALTGSGTRAAYAVRSSATAEDMPTATFAGQQDTYLNVIGPTEVLRHVSRCWASLFTERAVTYSLRNGVDHRKVQMGVVVQQMVVPQAAGVLFTADPVTSNRKVLSVEATFGLGEALVAGVVNADVYKVRNGEIVDKAIASKQRALVASPGGGTREQPIEPARRDQSALTDAQILELAQLGRRIEAHFGCPQDIEWCLVDDGFEIVQSRPITTLFPVPEVDDGANHVYVSVGHQQMMTDAMKPLGLSMWQLTTPRPMAEAAGRLFVDVTDGLASPATRAGLLEVFGRSDPLLRDALQTILDRGDFVPTRPDDGPGHPILGAARAPIEADSAIVTELIARNEASIASLQRDIRAKSGSALFELILDDLVELRRRLVDPQSLQVIVAAMDAAAWLNVHLQKWLNETNAADTLTQSVPHNVTSEMGLALLDVADAIRPHPQVVAFLEDVDDDSFLDELPALDGGREAADAIRGYLDRYGMRCVGEIDITRPRWSERPSVLVSLILGNIKNFETGAARRRFDQARQEATKKEHELLERLRELPDGAQKAEETKRMIDLVRTFIGYREYPKYGMVRRYFEYKQALLAEADRLVDAGVLRERDDIFFLTFDELHDVVRTQRVDDDLIGQRKEAFASYEAIRPPRVLTSDGEVLSGSHLRDDLPTGALLGLAVSAGTVEGRARVVLDMNEADLEPGDILVTAHTDPSWSPVFVVVSGLVTEVGGLMTHGAVVAREYGLPAVVGVENATRLIPDGQRIRLNGSKGYVEILAVS